MAARFCSFQMRAIDLSAVEPVARLAGRSKQIKSRFILQSHSRIDVAWEKVFKESQMFGRVFQKTGEIEYDYKSQFFP